MRTTLAAGGPEGWTAVFSRTVDFIGESGMTPMRAVSLRGPAWAPRLGAIELGEGTPGGGVRPDGGGTGGLAPAGSGGGGRRAGGGGSGPFGADGGAGGGTFSADGGAGVGGLTIGGGGGRLAGAPPLGGKGLGATEGGGRSGAEARRIVFSGVRSAFSGGRAAGGPGGRLGKLIRAVSISTGTVGRCVVRVGKVIRTVSFFGSFKSAITTK